MWIFRSGMVLAAYIGMNIYSGLRVFSLVKYFFPSFRALIYWPLFLLCSFSYILVFFLRLNGIQPLRRIAMISLPALVYLFLALLVFDAARILLHVTGVMPKAPFFSAAAAGSALCFTVIMMIYGYFHARSIKTNYYEITLNKTVNESLSGGFRIALVSDLHIGSAVDRKWLGKIVDAVNETKPDLICLAGDLFDNNVSTLEDSEGITAELRRLNAAFGVYACQGNHDVDRMSLRNESSVDRTKEFLTKAGVDFLLDEVSFIAETFYIVGRRDLRPIGMAHSRKSAAELCSGLDRTRPLIIIEHQPLNFPELEEAGVDLILSGHTHRGQFFPGNIATKYIYKNAGAEHYGFWKGRTAQAVISSGAGVWGPPIRIATDSEVAVLDIKFKY
jgi:predicted MPP superfamily phosphohydrolase